MSTTMHNHNFGFGHKYRSRFDPDHQLRLSQEHWDKNEEICAALNLTYEGWFLGFPLLDDVGPVRVIREALENGDSHLNTIPLKRWDRAATLLEKQKHPLRPSWCLSLSEAVCALKHAAKVAAGCTRPEKQESEKGTRASSVTHSPELR